MRGAGREGKWLLGEDKGKRTGSNGGDTEGGEGREGQDGMGQGERGDAEDMRREAGGLADDLFCGELGRGASGDVPVLEQICRAALQEESRGLAVAYDCCPVQRGAPFRELGGGLRMRPWFISLLPRGSTGPLVEGAPRGSGEDGAGTNRLTVQQGGEEGKRKEGKQDIQGRREGEVGSATYGHFAVFTCSAERYESGRGRRHNRWVGGIGTLFVLAVNAGVHEDEEADHVAKALRKGTRRRVAEPKEGGEGDGGRRSGPVRGPSRVGEDVPCTPTSGEASARHCQACRSPRSIAGPGGR